MLGSQLETVVKKERRMRKEWANERIADVRSMRRNLNKATESPEGSAACVCPSPPYIHLSPSYSSGMAKLSITASSASPQGCRQVTAGEKCNKKKSRGWKRSAAVCSYVHAGWLDWPVGQSERKQNQPRKKIKILFVAFKAAVSLNSYYRFNKVLEIYSYRNVCLGVRDTWP